MAERPIILSDGQVSTLISGKRRHIFKPARYQSGGRFAVGDEAKQKARQYSGGLPMPRPESAIEVGDRLWVQEAMASVYDAGNNLDRHDHYRADCLGGLAPIPPNMRVGRMKRQVFDAKLMRRPQSRYILTVTAVRLCRVQDVTWEEIDAEGSARYPGDSKPQWWRRHYGILLPWDDNPEIVGISFAGEYANIDGHPLPARELHRPPSAVMEYFKTNAPQETGDAGE